MATIEWAGRHVETFPKIPQGWKILEGATNHPKGYIWIHNGESVFSKERMTALIKK